MQTKKHTLHNILFPALLFALIGLTLNAKQVNAQADTTEKCVELSFGVEKFYKECSDKGFLDSFSARIVDKSKSQI